ncbi:MAG: ATP synthase subunit I [Firmicutes bacterium]|nr:ATP synthase subunit I [Candidatus Colimorpha enterica]MDD6322768.1 ATP synthase subunit I [Bacillota bacterium]MDY2906059.1 ATP synthase subunit I [Eubacteriales bacterium]
MKIDGTVKKETAYVAIAEAILIAVMLAVYLIISKFTLNVLFAALTSGAVAVLNFFVMGLTVQKAVTVDDDSDRRKLIRASQLVRLLVMGVVVIVCAVFPKFDIFALFIPLFFPRLFAQARGIYGAVKDGKNGGRTE